MEKIRRAGVTDEAVLAVIGVIPRERFIPEDLFHQAYEDYALDIGEGQTISQPSVVARMTALAQVRPADRILEIGTGSGYQAAVLSRLARFVFSVERIPTLAEVARRRLSELRCANVSVQIMDGSLGWRAQAPYDAIIVTAAAPGVPSTLVEQLVIGGRLVVPVGRLRSQELVLVVRREEGLVESRHGAAGFVPLVGRAGFREVS